MIHENRINIKSIHNEEQVHVVELTLNFTHMLINKKDIGASKKGNGGIQKLIDKNRHTCLGEQHRPVIKQNNLFANACLREYIQVINTET